MIDIEEKCAYCGSYFTPCSEEDTFCSDDCLYDFEDMVYYVSKDEEE